MLHYYNAENQGLSVTETYRKRIIWEGMYVSNSNIVDLENKDTYPLKSGHFINMKGFFQSISIAPSVFKLLGLGICA